jgi:hypothetical protein
MGSPRSPIFLKGAFVQIESNSAVQKQIEFQYNPEKIERRIQVHENPKRRWFYKNRNEPSASEATPREFLTFNLVLDATDVFDDSGENPNRGENGICSRLSAIELLIYPKKYHVKTRSFMGITAPGAVKNPTLTLLVWGKNRILPVSILELHIIEELFDTELNPVRATVEITMSVLNDTDLQHNKKGLEYWNAHLSTLNSSAEKSYTTINLKDLKST